MTVVRIATVVEGYGEVEAVPVLLRRMAAVIRPGLHIDSPRPRRVGRGRLLRPGELETVVSAAVEQVGPGANVLVLLDADDDCPALVGPELVQRARKARPDVRFAAVLAKREFEAWFLAAAPSLASHRGLARSLQRPADAEVPRDCKGWLSRHRVDGKAYKPATDQAALTALFDLDMAREYSASFGKLWRDLERMLTGEGT